MRVPSCCHLSVELFGHAKHTPLGLHSHLCHEVSHGEPFWCVWLYLGERPDTSAGERSPGAGKFDLSSRSFPGEVYDDSWWSSANGFPGCCDQAVDLCEHVKFNPLSQHIPSCHDIARGEPSLAHSDRGGALVALPGSGRRVWKAHRGPFLPTSLVDRPSALGFLPKGTVTGLGLPQNIALLARETSKPNIAAG